MIKLLNIGQTSDGVIRLQSQLLVGTDTADFILENGILKNWSCNKGLNFHEINIPYEIVKNKVDMIYQPL